MKQLLCQIPFGSLPISDYSRNYILRMLPAIDYYLAIYNRSLDTMISSCGKKADECTLVDYGGGHGFLSLLAKKRGFRQVIYVDFNPDAVETVRVLTERLGFGPDVILQGDATTLRQWCLEQGEKPDILLGMDVIEHIYCLDDFFSEIFALAPDVRMLFTTASNPYNKRLCKKLRQAMVRDEALFLQQRKAFIAKLFPDLPASEVDRWATDTRGLNYDDIFRAVDSLSPNLLRDPYNTCDPQTGSWTERILPLSDYLHLLQPYGATLVCQPGQYNALCPGLKGLLSRILNGLITFPLGKRIAPFLYLIIN